VKRGALRRDQPVVDHLADEPVAQRDALVGAVAHEQAGVERLAQRGARARLRRAALEHRMRGLPTGGGDHREQLAGALRQRRDAQPHDVGDRRRHRRVAVAPGGEQLLDEERVAARAGVQLGGERGRHRRAVDRLELAGDVVAAERLEVEPRDERPPRELRDEAPRRVRGLELAGAVRERERDALGPEVAGEERDEVARRAVGPVEVLEHDQERPAFRRPAEQLERQLVQPALAEAVGEAPPLVFEPQAGQQRGERAARVPVELRELVFQRQLAQRRDHGRVRELLPAELEALPVQDEEPALAPARLERPDQAGLADPGLARDQREPRISRRRGPERVVERAQRPVAADDRPAGDLAAVLHTRE